MQLLLRYAFLFLPVCFVNDGWSQSSPVKKWTYSDCMQYATDHNLLINTLQLDAEAGRLDLLAAKANKFPSLSASVSNSFNNAKNLAGNDNHLINQLGTSGSYGLNSSLTLWNGNYLNNTIRQKQLITESYDLLILQSVNNINLLITQAFLEILLAKENLKYIEDVVSTSQARVTQAELLYDAGSIAKKDLLQLQAQLAGDKYLQVQIQNAIRQNILSLKQVIQLQGDSSFDIETPDVIEVFGVLPPISAVQQSALQNFPEIKVGRLGLNIAELEIAKARAGFKPTLAASAGLGTGYIGVITNPVVSKPGYFTQTGNNFYQRLGLSLYIPIFANRINKTNLAKANIGYKQAFLNLKNDELILSQSVEKAYLNASNAQQAWHAANQHLLAAKESYRIANEQFKLGAINTYDLLQQRNQYIQAVQEFTQSKYTAIMQQKIYEFYMGIPIVF